LADAKEDAKANQPVLDKPEDQATTTFWNDFLEDNKGKL